MTDDQRPLGMHTSCTKCGGANRWTGRRRERREAGFGATVFHVVDAEIECTACGHAEWTALGDSFGPMPK